MVKTHVKTEMKSYLTYVGAIEQLGITDSQGVKTAALKQKIKNWHSTLCRREQMNI